MLRVIAVFVLLMTMLAPRTASAVKTLRPGSAFKMGGIYCVVDSVFLNSPAAQAGLQRGDTLLSLQGATLIPETVAPALAGLPNGTEAVLSIGRASGRREVRFVPNSSSPRLGIQWIPQSSVSEASASIRDQGLWIAASVREWSRSTFVRIDVTNLSDAMLAVGPDSFYVVDGLGQLCRVISGDEFLTLKYGGRISSVAGSIPHSMGEAIVQGAAEGWAQGSREAVTRDILNGDMRPMMIPSRVSSGGTLIIALEHILGPIQLHARIAGAHYVFEFEGGARSSGR